MLYFRLFLYFPAAFATLISKHSLEFRSHAISGRSNILTIAFFNTSTPFGRKKISPRYSDLELILRLKFDTAIWSLIYHFCRIIQFSPEFLPERENMHLPWIEQINFMWKNWTVRWLCAMFWRSLAMMREINWCEDDAK